MGTLCCKTDTSTVAEENKDELSKSRQYTTTKFSQTVNHNEKGNKTYILVTDLSGLTRLTREYGILHCISMIMRQRQILCPIITKLFKPLTICWEADNAKILFDDAMNALLCGLLIIHIFNKHNADLPPNKKHFQILIDGVAIDVIDGEKNEIIQDKQTRNLYNISKQTDHNPMHNAFVLAEDIADNGEFLISADFYNEINSKIQQSLSFNKINSEKFGDIFRIDGNYSNLLQSVLDSEYYPLKICNINDKTYSSDESVLQVLQRYNFDKDVSNIDVELNKKFLIYNCAALMFDINIDIDDEKMKDTQPLMMKKEIILLNFLKDIYDAYDKTDIYEIGKSWLIFRSSNASINCFECALKIQKSVKEFNTTNHDNMQMNISSIGCDVGDMFMIHNTDICFGDPINTASKLGQDNHDGNVIVSDRFYKQANIKQVKDCKFEETKFSGSNVEMKAYIVNVI